LRVKTQWEERKGRKTEKKKRPFGWKKKTISLYTEKKRGGYGYVKREKGNKRGKTKRPIGAENYSLRV